MKVCIFPNSDVFCEQDNTTKCYFLSVVDGIWWGFFLQVKRLSFNVLNLRWRKQGKWAALQVLVFL